MPGEDSASAAAKAAAPRPIRLGPLGWLMAAGQERSERGAFLSAARTNARPGRQCCGKAAIINQPSARSRDLPSEPPQALVRARAFAPAQRKRSAAEPWAALH